MHVYIDIVQTLAEMMEKGSEAKWGNWIGYVLLPLSIALRDNPLDYIQKAKEAMDRKKPLLKLSIYIPWLSQFPTYLALRYELISLNPSLFPQN